MLKFLRKLIKPSVVHVKIEHVKIHVVHAYRSVPIYSMSWLEKVYVDGELLTASPKESHTAMALGIQHTYGSYAELADKINQLLGR